MAKHHCAVVILTKNAMAHIAAVIKKVLDQQTPWSYEVIVIDSGSRDGTREFLRGVEGIRLIEIVPEEFGHGRTRNLGIDAADADYVAFLTHDAQPANEYWLSSLVAAIEVDPRIAGVFGRHVAYDTASPFTKMDLELHFQGFEKLASVVHRNLDPSRYESDVGWRQFLHFYSDNNSLMRKSVWSSIPYPDVEFAEDQLWARSIIEAGYWKAYAHDAVVYHSHEYSFTEQLRRAFDESRNFRKYFGYKLSPRLLPALSSMARFSLEACHQKVDSRFGRVTVTHRLKRAAQRIAVVAGHCLGANYQKLPRFICNRLSLDQRLFNA